MHKVQLGDHVKEVITGFEGVIIGRVEYITGCEQGLVAPRSLKEDGDLKASKWFDEDRLEVVKKGAVKIKVTAPGPDAEAPIK